jgi:hypothetical protein
MWERETEREDTRHWTERNEYTKSKYQLGENDSGRNDGRATFNPPVFTDLGFRPSCTCNAPARPATILDPFNGAATTGLVCQQLNRRYIGLDLSMEYLQQSRKRLGHDALEAWQNGGGKIDGAAIDDLPMFGGSK